MASKRLPVGTRVRILDVDWQPVLFGSPPRIVSYDNPSRCVGTIIENRHVSKHGEGMYGIQRDCATNPLPEGFFADEFEVLS